jgi:hypothetical protein
MLVIARQEENPQEGDEMLMDVTSLEPTGETKLVITT